MARLAGKDYVKVSRDEYLRLKKLAEIFDAFWGYMEHLRDIKEAREEIGRGETIAQEELFRRFGV